MVFSSRDGIFAERWMKIKILFFSSIFSLPFSRMDISPDMDGNLVFQIVEMIGCC